MTTLAQFLAGEPVDYLSFSSVRLTARYGYATGYPLKVLTIRGPGNRIVLQRPYTESAVTSWFNQIDAEIEEVVLAGPGDQPEYAEAG